MNFLNAFYEVEPGTVISTSRFSACSLERTLFTSTNLMSLPTYTPPGCLIDLVIDNI